MAGADGTQPHKQRGDGAHGSGLLDFVHQLDGRQILGKAPAWRLSALQHAKKVRQLVHIGVFYNVVAVAAVVLKAGVGVDKPLVAVLELVQRLGVALPEQVDAGSGFWPEAISFICTYCKI